VQNRNRGANNDNLTASAGPIANAAETTSPPIWSNSVGTEANYRVPIEVVGPWLIVLTRKGLFT